MSDGLRSLDLDRVQANALFDFTPMARTDQQVFHRQRYREAVQAVGKLGSHVLDWTVCREVALDRVGETLGWTSRPQAYAAAAASGSERHVLGFEADFGAGPVWRLSSRVNPAQLPVVDEIQRALAPLKVSRGGNEAAGGADLDGLAKQGMALLSPDLDGTLYFDVHHTANDTMDKVDPNALRQSVAAYAVSAWLGARYSGDWQAVAEAKPPRR